jgi:hypothetical protein
MTFENYIQIYKPIVLIKFKTGLTATVTEFIKNFYEVNTWTITEKGLFPGKKFSEAIGFIICENLHDFELIEIKKLELDKIKEIKNL